MRDSAIVSLVVAFVNLGIYVLIDPLLRHDAVAMSGEPTEHDKGTTKAAVIEPHLVFTGIGVVLMAAGFVLRVISMRTLGRFFTRTLRTREQQHVVSTGIYRVVRHPGYLGDSCLRRFGDCHDQRNHYASHRGGHPPCFRAKDRCRKADAHHSTGRRILVVQGEALEAHSTCLLKQGSACGAFPHGGAGSVIWLPERSVGLTVGTGRRPPSEVFPRFEQSLGGMREPPRMLTAGCQSRSCRPR